MIETGEARWSEPYFDDSGGEVMMVTYCVPIHDRSGKVVAVMGFAVNSNTRLGTDVLHGTFIRPFTVNLSATYRL